MYHRKGIIWKLPIIKQIYSTHDVYMGNHCYIYHCFEEKNPSTLSMDKCLLTDHYPSLYLG